MKQPFHIYLARRYLDPENIPKTPSQEVFGRLGCSKHQRDAFSGMCRCNFVESK